MLDAYGGSKALAGVRTVVARGRIDDYIRQVSGGYARIMRRPGSLRIESRPEEKETIVKVIVNLINRSND